MKPCKVASILILVVAVCVCHGQTKPSADAEARNVAKQLWEKILVKCDDSYFYGTLQMKGTSFDISEDSLSSADRANGIQWRGGAIVGSQLIRAYHPANCPDDPRDACSKPNWGEWSNGTSASQWKKIVKVGTDATRPGAPAYIRMTKVEGRWTLDEYDSLTIHGSPYDPDSQSRKLSCSDIPGVSSNPRSSQELEETWRDPATSLTWARKDNGDNVNWEQAAAYCKNLKLDGYDDWRLPTAGELNGVYDTDARTVKGRLNLSGWEWSSTQFGSVEAWEFEFDPGVWGYKRWQRQRDKISEDYDNRALCVRGASWN
jgi:hypothetical protein